MPPDNTTTPPASHDPALARRAVDLKLSAGLTAEEIAAELGISRATASRLLANAERLLTLPPEVVRMRELLDLEWVEEELRTAWRRSTEDKVTVNLVDEDGPKGRKVGETTKTEGQAGDSSLLRTFLMAKQRRAALLGLDAPKKVHVLEEHRQAVIAVLLPAILEGCLELGLEPKQIEVLASRIEGVAGLAPAPEAVEAEAVEVEP